MSKVYITSESDKDFTPATEFGQLVFLTHKDFNNHGSGHNRELADTLCQRLARFNAEKDWLIVSAGSPYVAAAACMILGRMGVQSVRVLRWDNRDFKYRPLQIDIGAAAPF